MRDARELLAAVGYGRRRAVAARSASGVDIGPAYVGNVGAGDVKDFTALGDVVNTAARLQGAGRAGQIVISERLFGRLTDAPADARRRASP